MYCRVTSRGNRILRYNLCTCSTTSSNTKRYDCVVVYTLLNCLIVSQFLYYLSTLVPGLNGTYSGEMPSILAVPVSYHIYHWVDINLSNLFSLSHLFTCTHLIMYRTTHPSVRLINIMGKECASTLTVNPSKTSIKGIFSTT